MIVTLTKNAAGHPRIYLGAKSSLECWLEPKPDKVRWTLHVEEAVTGNKVMEADKRAYVIQLLIGLANELGVAPGKVLEVPFQAIAKLHEADPYLQRRVPAPRNRMIENGYAAVAPPALNFPDSQWQKRRNGKQIGRPAVP